MGDSFAAKAHGVKKFGVEFLYGVNALSGITTAALLMGSAKLFALSQKIVWSHYVAKPSSNGKNTRLAQYGAGSKPWMDFQLITKAFISPTSLPEGAWKLKTWSKRDVGGKSGLQ